jgi:hypothetical protein
MGGCSAALNADVPALKTSLELALSKLSMMYDICPQ